MAPTSDSGERAFRVGTYYDMMPIPPIDENCVALDAGPVRFVVESRHLTAAIARAALPAEKLPEEETRPGLDDYGASLHVYGSADGLEHLRFDCFDDDPHYHYVMQADGGQLVCPLDPVAEGDVITWVLDRVRRRLPEMLDFARAAELAAAVRADAGEVERAMDQVAELLGRADESARAQFASAGS